MKIGMIRALFKDILSTLFFITFRLGPIFERNTPSYSINQKVMFTTISEKELWFFVSLIHNTNIIYGDQISVRKIVYRTAVRYWTNIASSREFVDGTYLGRKTIFPAINQRN